MLFISQKYGILSFFLGEIRRNFVGFAYWAKHKYAQG